MLAAHDALPTYATKVVSLDPTAAKYFFIWIFNLGIVNGANVGPKFSLHNLNFHVINGGFLLSSY